MNKFKICCILVVAFFFGMVFTEVIFSMLYFAVTHDKVSSDSIGLVRLFSSSVAFGFSYVVYLMLCVKGET